MDSGLRDSGPKVSTRDIRFVLNGEEVAVAADAGRLLLSVLRDELGLTGTKEGCGVGVCGSCSVIVDGELVSACLMPAVFVDGAAVTTIEGLASDARLTPLQDAFIRHGGLQCGICTPGQLLAASALLEETPRPTEEQVRRWMMGNLCRCTGYYGIVRSVIAAAGERSTSEPAEPA